ncbi:Uncharacterised protein [Vibrio cholerae]|nr:Uncharacterised protein [Vibrio cholerae]
MHRQPAHHRCLVVQSKTLRFLRSVHGLTRGYAVHHLLSRLYPYRLPRLVRKR